MSDENPQNHDKLDGDAAVDKPSQAEGEDTPEQTGQA